MDNTGGIFNFSTKTHNELTTFAKEGVILLCPMHKVSAWCKPIDVESRRNENKNFNLMRRKLFLPSPFSHPEML
jgi:hypothetical protein